MTTSRVPANASGSPLLWVGGKRRIAPQILPHILAMAEGRTTLIEAFTGSGALGYAWLAMDSTHRVVWMDAVIPLLDTHLMVAERTAEVRTALAQLQATWDPGNAEAWRDLRDRIMNDPDEATRAAAFLVINRAGYNGLWRVNRAGGCNVPWGRWTLPEEDWTRFLAWIQTSGEATRGRIDVQPWNAQIGATPILPEGVVYVDPPYPGTYSGYGRPWTLPDYALLSGHIGAWRQHGHPVLVSFPAANAEALLPTPTDTVGIRIQDTVGGRSAPRGHRDEVLLLYSPGSPDAP